MDKVQIATAAMAAAYDEDPYVRGWMDGYAAGKTQAAAAQKEQN